jgi:predicted PurR-regulated permease PerM
MSDLYAMTDQQNRERSTALIYYGIVLVLAYLMYLVCEPFLRPLAWAGISAVFFYPQYNRLKARMGKNRAATVSTIFIALIIIVPFVLIVTAFVQQANETFGHLDFKSSSAGITRLKSAWGWLQSRGLGLRLPSFEDAAQEAAAWLAGVVAAAAGSLVRNIIEVVVNLIISVFTMFFLFRDGDIIMDRVRRILPFDSKFSELQIEKTGELIRASISATLVVAITQGTVGGIAFAVLGIGAPIFWGVTMVFFALLPLGAGVVWLPVALWLLMTGQVGRGIALIAIGFGIIGLIDNFLRPMLLSGRTEMSGLLVFISLLGGIAAFGLLGIVLGPVIMAVTMGFIDAYATEQRTATDIEKIIEVKK